MARVVLKHVRVDFPIYALQRNLRTILFNRATGGLIRHQGESGGRVVVEALVDVSMTLDDGDRVALIGHNGSGKSTLLKVIAGILQPIEGMVEVEGTVTPLFDMMPGFDPEDSGYENIITAGLLLGLNRQAIERKIPDIEEFSELGEYLSLPVRTYSAGMMMRLGFSLVTALDPDVLLMDEIIATADARFAERAEKRLNEFLDRSRIVVVAGHNPPLIKSICNKAALLTEGRLIGFGSVAEIFEQYDTMLHGLRASPPVQAAEASGNTSADETGEAAVEQPTPIADNPDLRPLVPQFTPLSRLASECAECLAGSVETLDGALCERPQIDAPFRLCLRYRLTNHSAEKILPSFHIFDDEMRHVLVSTPAESAPTGRGDYEASCRIEPYALNTGRYTVALGLGSPESGQPVYFYAERALRFEVIEQPDADPRRHGYQGEFPGVTRMRLQWEIVVLEGANT